MSHEVGMDVFTCPSAIQVLGANETFSMACAGPKGHPAAHQCPLTGEVMLDPVILAETGTRGAPLKLLELLSRLNPMGFVGNLELHLALAWSSRVQFGSLHGRPRI